MLTRRSPRVAAVLSTVALLTVAAGGAAYADNVANTLDGSIDAVAEVMPLNVGGLPGTTTLYVSPANNDGKQGCNLTGSTTLTASVTSSDPTVATVSPSSVTFTACNDTKTLTVTPVSQGTATVSVGQVSNTTGGTFSFTGATFTVNVAPPANTAPTVSVAGVTGGAAYDVGSVPAATCQVTDAEDGSSSFAAALSPVTGVDAADGIGSQTASCSYTDAGGLTASASETYAIVDPSAPVIGYTLTPAVPDGDNGWYTAATVQLTWTVTEPQSPGSLVTVGCVDQTITADQALTQYTCSATSAGGSAGPASVSVQRDATAPSVSAGAVTAGTPGANGWYTTGVTATFTGSDALSGLADTTQEVTTSGEGVITIASPAFTDRAGNTTPAGATDLTVSVDTTDPTATFDGSIGSVYFGAVPAAPTCTATDAVSGPAGCVVTGYSTAVGSHTLTATATDNAGRTSTATQTYTVNPWTTKGFYQPVDLGGVLNSVKGGSTVPVKFELFAGSTELTDPGLLTMSAKKVVCTSGAVLDDIEMVSTGSTSLRYDATAGQFLYNWKTPTGAGSCYQLTMTADDGSTVSALFRLK